MTRSVCAIVLVPVLVTSACFSEADTVTEPSSTTESGGSTGDVGTEGSDGEDVAGDGETDGITCDPEDPHEPNEHETESHQLPPVPSQCDPETPWNLSGVLSGGLDVDWYRYRADGSDWCAIDPEVVVNSSGPLRVCQFFDCFGEGSPAATCHGASLSNMSPDGLPGCCSDREESPTFFVTQLGSCSGSLWYVYIRVDQGTADVCTTYTIDYHF